MTSDYRLDALRYRLSQRERVLYLRQNSSDAMLIGQVLVDEAFALRSLPRLPELQSWLSDCRGIGMRPLILDAGANIGLSSIALSAEVPDALIVAIEPEPTNFELLVANTEGLPVLPLPAALAARPGTVLLEDPGRGEWGYQTAAVPTEPERIAMSVPAVTVAEIVSAHACDFLPFIVKIDIEGAEADVFAGDTRWVDTVPLIIVELHDWMLPRDRTAQPVLKRLIEADRDFVIRGENIFSMGNALLAAQPITPNRPGGEIS